MRQHCIISVAPQGDTRKWIWHTEIEPGNLLRQSPEEFPTFEDCLNDARSHGFYHVEIPLLG